MPTWGYGRRLIRLYCKRPFTWSTSRGGCRFDPGHAGACKPGRA